jgi:hypothetical protein
LLDLGGESWCCESILDGGLIARINASFTNVKLSAVEWDVRYCGPVSGVYGLVVDGFVVCVAVELRVEGEVYILSLVILVAFHMGEGDVARGLIKGTDHHVHNVPISLECAIRETGLEWMCGMDTFEEGIVVAAQLEVPGWVTQAKVE